MSYKHPSRHSARTVQATLLVVGGAMIAYAISDHPFYGGEPGFGALQMLIAAAGAVLGLCGLLPDRIAGTILLVAVTSLVMLAITEITGELILGSRHRPIYQADERLIFKFVPNRRSTMTHARINGGGTVSHRINSQGFRGEELRSHREMLRVAVYGDSFIHAFYTPDELTFTAQLGARLAARTGRQVEVINAGVSSYGPDQVALKMEDEFPRLRPDAVIVAIFAGNDYGDLLRNKMFRLAANGTLVENRWKLDAQVRVWFELGQRESILKRALRSAFGRERTPSHGQAEAMDPGFLLAEAQREYDRFVVDGNDVVTNTHVDYYSADISLTPSSPSARYKVALMRAVLQRIRDSAVRNGVPMAFLLIPHPMDVARGSDWGTIDTKRYPEYESRNQIRPLEEMAQALRVPFLSLYDLYRAHGADSLYLRGGDDHWNAAGQALAAKAAADLPILHALSRTVGRPISSSNAIDAPPPPTRAR